MGNCLRCLTSCFRSVFSKSQDDEETSPLLGKQRPTPADTQVVRQKQSASVDRRVTVGAGQPIGGKSDTGRRSDKYHRIKERKEGENPVLESQMRRLQEVHFYLSSICSYITCISHISYLSQRLIQGNDG